MRMPNSRQISDEQEEIYTDAPMEGSVMIAGPPGTGKTVIAFLRGNALNKRKKSAKVLMYSRVLQKYTANVSDDDSSNVESDTLLSWVYKWWKAHKILTETYQHSSGKRYLDCDYNQRDDVKDLGAQWDRLKQKWYVTEEVYQQAVDLIKPWLADPESVHDDSENRRYLDSEFHQKEEVKALGAKWDNIKRKWYVTESVFFQNEAEITPWLSGPESSQNQSAERIYLDCEFEEKDQVKALGARWDKAVRKWYITENIYNRDQEKFAKWISDSSENEGQDYDPPKISDFHYDWSQMLEKMAIRLSEKQEITDWGHLIIDEAQDFPNEMYAFFRFVSSKMKNGGMTILADENQRLNESENSSISEIKKSLAIDEKNFYLLTENFRNTLEIALLASTFYVGLPTGIPALPKVRGDKPELFKAKSLNEQVDYIVKSLRIRGYGEVGVFAQNDNMRQTIFNKLQHQLKNTQYSVQSYSSKNENEFPADQLVFDQAGTVTVINRQSCKGLEFDAVFIPEIQVMPIDESNLDSFRMNMYVMCSRARKALCLLFSSTGNELPEIINYLPARESGIMEYTNE